MCNSGWTEAQRAESFFSVIGEFFFVSVSTMTTAGQGMAYPVTAMSRSAAIMQQLASIFFSTVLLSLGMSKVQM